MPKKRKERDIQEAEDSGAGEAKAVLVKAKSKQKVSQRADAHERCRRSVHFCT